MSKSNAPPPLPRPLSKQHSWSPDTGREEVWLRRKGSFKAGRRQTKCVTDDDLDELKACIELGFGFEPNSPDLDPKLANVLPALGFYCNVNKQYGNSLSRSSSASSLVSEGGSSSCSSILDPGDDPEMVKMRLKQWAQVVACSVRQFSTESKTL